jgi:MinD-like ATPase involved in chromosome partitioning or flagellar assembly
MSKHMDEARAGALRYAETELAEDQAVARAVLIDDLFGRIRLVVWPADQDAASAFQERVQQRLTEECGPFWSGDIWVASGTNGAEQRIYEAAWEEARRLSEDGRIRLLERHRSREGWFKQFGGPPWALEQPGPPILVFYSFKGGVGRSTALAAYAIHAAQQGKRVAVIDFDLDAPGVGALLAAAPGGTTAPWGVVDFLLEHAEGGIDFRDYYQNCADARLAGSGTIATVPAGVVNDAYLQKVARIDLGPAPEPKVDAVRLFLERVRSDISPDVILVDSRSGLSSAAGLLLSGYAHLTVIFGTASEQSWQGLVIVLDRLGAQLVREGRPQADCLIVQSMVADNAGISERAVKEFAERSLDEFSAHYYAADAGVEPEESDLWVLGDTESSDAPHQPVVLHYAQRLAHYQELGQVAQFLLDDPDYRRLCARIDQRIGWSRL